jgi:hypothetical protein
MLGMIEGLPHEPRKGLRTIFANPFADEFNERRIQ